MKLPNLSRHLLLVVFVLASAVVALGQTAEVSGVVKDTSQAVVPNAAITLMNENTGIKRTATSNDQGFYTIPFLQPGSYKATVQVPGFQTISRPGITLTVGQQARIDFVLQVGAVAQTITVEGGAPLLNTQDPSVSTIINRKFIENLPLNGRNFHTLIELTPGVVLTPAGGQTGRGQFSVNGQRTDTNYFVIDGVSANFASFGDAGLVEGAGGSLPAFGASGGTSNLVSIDAMEEFRIQTSTYSPEFGRQPGAQVSIVTRSGTNQFHGTLFEFFRNDVLDATDWFVSAFDLEKPALRQNDFGGVLGGPIVKDRTFFFFSYEGLRLRLPQVGFATVPTVNARQIAPAGIKPLLEAFPLPNGSDFGNNTARYTTTWSNPSSSDSYSLRLDHSWGKLRLFGRYNHAPNDNNSLSSGFNEFISDSKIQTFTTGATLAFTPNIVNDFRANWSRAPVGQHSAATSEWRSHPSPGLGAVSLFHLEPGKQRKLHSGLQWVRGGEGCH